MARIVRSAVKQAIVDQLSAVAALSAVNVNTGTAPQITRVFEGHWQSLERIVVGNTTGDISIPTIRSGAKTTDDDFTVSVFFVTSIPGQTALQAEERCTVLVEAAVGALVLTANLSGSIAGVMSAVPAGLDGPDVELGDVNGTDTNIAVATLTVHCTARVFPA